MDLSEHNSKKEIKKEKILLRKNVKLLYIKINVKLKGK